MAIKNPDSGRLNSILETIDVIPTASVLRRCGNEHRPTGNAACMHLCDDKLGDGSDKLSS
jgi:hypothetical protein